MLPQEVLFPGVITGFGDVALLAADAFNVLLHGGGDETLAVAVFIESLTAVEMDQAVLDISLLTAGHLVESVHHAPGVGDGLVFAIELAGSRFDTGVHGVDAHDVDVSSFGVLTHHPVQAGLMLGTCVDEARQLMG